MSKLEELEQAEQAAESERDRLALASDQAYDEWVDAALALSDYTAPDQLASLVQAEREAWEEACAVGGDQEKAFWWQAHERLRRHREDYSV